MTFWKRCKSKCIQNRKKYSLILIILVIIFIILNLFKSNKNIFDDIMILSLWESRKGVSEYDISQNKVEIDVFATINNIYKKIAPGTKGNFVIKFKRPTNLKYKIKINEKTSKPQNLYFIIDNEIYLTLKEMENAINEKFSNNEKLTINWEWKYYIDRSNDIQDTKDAKNLKKYIFEIEVIVEELERIGI